ncbi:MAG: ribonuclease P protein component [Candidatus Azambacteria bacterium]|nr:ribonuclease P protein component [Candidatus Azambacteria bacterium]
MLPGVNRLKLNSDFKKIFRGGKVSENQLVKIKFLSNGKKHSRFGFIVSNKFSKKAVVRNLVKRRFRAAVGFLLKNIEPGIDVAIWPKTAFGKADYTMALDALKELFIKNDILSI